MPMEASPAPAPVMCGPGLWLEVLAVPPDLPAQPGHGGKTGALWGDYIGDHLRGVADRVSGQDYSGWRSAWDAWRETAVHLHEDLFAIVWAGFAVAMIAIGRRMESRFVEIAGIVFLAINAFTQYFEYFQDDLWALVFGGIALVGIALGLVRFEAGRTALPA